MKNSTSVLPGIRMKTVVRFLVFDAAALASVYLIPILGNLAGIPAYMIEPMRLMVMVSIAHMNRTNSLILAVVLPFFSWTVSGHPEFLKMLVMCSELAVNVFLFYFLVNRIGQVFLAAVASVIASKIFCYILYLFFFSMMFIREEAETSFLLAQLVTTLVYSYYVSVFYKRRSQ